jgi:uncharacterized hydrophobic protein (TIGR00271 family)
MSMTTKFPEARKLQVNADLLAGSEPGKRFFFFVAVSTLIAGLGLVMDSTAVVIGAMLVAPLMTPILGLGLGLVNGDAVLLGRAMRSEIAGVAIAVLVSILLGMAIPFFRPTAEMLSRTEPNLFDLFVAVLAGMAGAYALVDEKVSPALPGVAISTAIVPPLANCGLSIALGAYEGAMGSFLLFFTNFLSILLVSALVFHLTGMSSPLKNRSGVVAVQSFAVAIVGFLVVAGFLGVELARMMDRLALRQAVGTALRVELSQYRVSNVGDLFIERKDGKVLVLAKVEAPRVINPRRVGILQEKLRETTGEPVELFVRTALTHDVSARGSTELGSLEKLDGYYPIKSPSSQTVIIQRSEQVIREFLDSLDGLTLQDVDIYQQGDDFGVLAEVSGFRDLDPDEIGLLEDSMRDALPDASLKLVVVQETATVIDRYGRFRTDFSKFQALDPPAAKSVEALIRLSDEWIRRNGFSVLSVSTEMEDGKHLLLLEVSGPRLFAEVDLAGLKKALSEIAPDTRVFVRSQIESVVGDETFSSFDELLDTFRQRNRKPTE